MKQKKNNYLICFKLMFFCLFFSNNIVFAETNIQHTQSQQDDDFYDLDYEPSNDENTIIVWDPWEKMNRKIFSFNMFFTDYLIRPIYYGFYSKITTTEIRKSVHNVYVNFKAPMVFTNYILQLDFKNAAKTFYSFVMNTTYGVFGLFDVASIQDVNPPSTNLSMTLAKYGVPAGPYFVVPFFGSNDIRGMVSWGGELAVDPFGYNVFKIGGKRDMFDEWVYTTRISLFVLDNSTYLMENLYDLMKASFDPYVMVRDAYGQSQIYKIKQVKGE
ncbi:MAG TPA: VacJ family lipoprotein [Rickettsiales bacterium]|nr:VacJ family lipoprotein [Rickettsiales bacterium]